MPVDDQAYSRMSGTWWGEKGLLAVLKALNPARFGYMHRVLLEKLPIAPRGVRTLDIGCGDGILAEEFARLRCRVTGVDPSEASVEAAQEHAALQGLDIECRRGTGEALPFDEPASRSPTAATCWSTWTIWSG